MHTDGTLHVKGCKGADTDRNSVLTTDTHTDTHTDRQSTSASVELRFAAKKSLSQLREDNEFTDVTLISEDKVKFSAHKILLSSCSETFKFILKECNQTKSILFLSGINSVNLKFIRLHVLWSSSIIPRAIRQFS